MIYFIQNKPTLNCSHLLDYTNKEFNLREVFQIAHHFYATGKDLVILNALTNLDDAQDMVESFKDFCHKDDVILISDNLPLNFKNKVNS